MFEYSTEAVVLDKEPIGESDALVFLYTPGYGKVVARAKSARKITSKLAASLEPANIVSARVLSYGTYQIADAVSLERGASWRSTPESLRALLHFLRSIKELAPEGEPLHGIWDELRVVFSEPPRSLAKSYKILLRSAGFDARNARCEGCHTMKPDYFIPSEALFICKACRRGDVRDAEHIALVFQS